MGNKLYNQKSAAFKAIKQALNEAYASEPDLKDPESEEYKKVESNLKYWGVSIEKLPDAVAKEYNEKISLATEFETYAEDSASGADFSYKKGDTVLEKEGAYEVKNSVTGLKEELVTKIREKYFKEVDDSTKVLSAESKTALKGVIGNSIDTWLNANPSAKIADYVNSSTPTDEGEVKGSGLIYWVEYKLESQNEAFNAERAINAATTAKADLQTEVDRILTLDPVYASAISYSKISENATVNPGKLSLAKGKVGNVVNNTDYSVNNPFFTNIQAIDKDGKTGATGTAIVGYIADSEIEGTNVGSIVDNTTYSIKTYLNNLFNNDGSVKGLTNPSPLDVQQWAVETLPDFEDIYYAAKEEYEEDQKVAAKFGSENYTFDDNYYGEDYKFTLTSKWETKFTANGEWTMGDVSNARVGFENSKTNLTALNNSMTAFVNRLKLVVGAEVSKSEYDHYKDIFVPSETVGADKSTLFTEYQKIVDSILSDSLEEDTLSEFAASISSYYLADVAAYREAQIEILDKYVDTIVSTDLTMTTTQRTAMKNRLDTAKKVLEGSNYSSLGTLYSGNSIGEVKAWFNDASAYVGDKTGPTSGEITENYSDMFFKLATGATTNIAVRKNQVSALIANEASTEWNSEKAKWGVDAGTDGTLVVKSLYITEDVAEEIGLSGTWAAGSEENAGDISYDVSKQEGVDAWFADAIKVRNYLEAVKYENDELASDVKDTLVAFLKGLNGKTIDTTHAKANYEAQVKAVVKAVTGNEEISGICTLSEEGTTAKTLKVEFVGNWDTEGTLTLSISGYVLTYGNKTYNSLVSNEVSAYKAALAEAIKSVDGTKTTVTEPSAA